MQSIHKTSFFAKRSKLDVENYLANLYGEKAKEVNNHKESTNFSINTKVSSILTIANLQGKLVLVENSWSKILEEMGEAVVGKRYGRK